MENKILCIKNIDNSSYSLRKVRSYSCRNRRIKSINEQEVRQYWSSIGINYVKKFINFSNIFSNNSSVILEIGFGTGMSLVKSAKKFINKNYLGIEVYYTGVLQCLRSAHSFNLKNLRIINYDAEEVVKHMISDYSINRIQILFPDPWKKNRHKKRRIIKKDFSTLLLKKLEKNGKLYISTDCKDYAENIIAIINNIKGYENLSKKNTFVKKPIDCPTTRFENKSKILGHEVYHILYRKSC